MTGMAELEAYGFTIYDTTYYQSFDLMTIADRQFEEFYEFCRSEGLDKLAEAFFLIREESGLVTLAQVAERFRLLAESGELEIVLREYNAMQEYGGKFMGENIYGWQPFTETDMAMLLSPLLVHFAASAAVGGFKALKAAVLGTASVPVADVASQGAVTGDTVVRDAAGRIVRTIHHVGAGSSAAQVAAALSWKTLGKTALQGMAFYAGASGTFRLLDLALMKLGIFTSPTSEADMTSAWFKIYEGCLSEGYTAAEAKRIADQVLGYSPKYQPKEFGAVGLDAWEQFEGLSEGEAEELTPEQKAELSFAYEKRLYELRQSYYPEESAVGLPVAGERPMFYGTYGEWAAMTDKERSFYSGYGGELYDEGIATPDDLMEFFNLMQDSPDTGRFDVGDSPMLIKGEIFDPDPMKAARKYGLLSDFEEYQYGDEGY